MYKQFFIIFSLIIVHELGHFLVAFLFRWEIDKINIYPYGGCVKFNASLNKPIYQEFLILISGPLFQLLLFFIYGILYNYHYINYRDFLNIQSYNYILLAFNLLPIYPLDGGKLFNLLTNYYFCYKKSNTIVIIASYIITIILILKYNNYNLLLMSGLIFFENTKYLKNQRYLYNKLLLDRYLNNYNFKKYRIINNYKNMYREKRHIIKNNNSYITEKDYLIKRFNGDIL